MIESSVNTWAPRRYEWTELNAMSTHNKSAALWFIISAVKCYGTLYWYYNMNEFDMCWRLCIKILTFVDYTTYGNFLTMFRINTLLSQLEQLWHYNNSVSRIWLAFQPILPTQNVSGQLSFKMKILVHQKKIFAVVWTCFTRHLRA